MDLLGSVDSTPPTLLKISSLDYFSALLVFDEPIDENTVRLQAKGNGIASKQVKKTSLHIVFKDAMSLGVGLPLEGRVEDLRGNSVSFSLLLWAKNTNPPSLLINEISTKGTENNPDRVEIFVTNRGNLGGVTLFAGTEQEYTDRIIFPEVWVERGDYLVVAFSKGEIPTETYRSESQAGLSANNGCLTLAVSPQWDGNLLDAAIWGNHTTQTHEGFGSRTLLEQVQYLAEKRHWNSREAGGPSTVVTALPPGPCAGNNREIQTAWMIGMYALHVTHHLAKGMQRNATRIDWGVASPSLTDVASRTLQLQKGRPHPFSGQPPLHP